MRSMNLEHTVIIVASLMIAAIVGLYTFDMEKGLHIAYVQADAGVATTTPGAAEEMTPNQLDNAQALIEYQATLPRYFVEPNSVERQTEIGPGPEQLVDRQMLADYQATLTIGYVPMEVVEGTLVTEPKEPFMTSENR